VQAPVHVVYYRRRPGVVEVIRVLHDRMDPGAHVGLPADARKR
jgi:plasmid stabilization system protein ParE